MAVLISTIIITFLCVIQISVPFLVKRTVVFGVTIPDQYIEQEELLKYKKQYASILTLLSVITILGFVFWTFTNAQLDETIILIGVVIAFAIIFVSLSLYFYYHGKIKRLKRDQRWLENLKQVNVTDLSVRNDDEMLPWYVYLLPMVITIGLLGYVMMNYDLLPNQIPTHWGVNGPDAWTEKTPFAAMQLSLTLFTMQILFLGIHVATKNSGIKLSATNFNSSRNRQLKLRKSSSWFLFFVLLLVTMLMSYLQLTTLHPELASNSLMLVVPFIFLIVVLGSSLIFALKVGRSDKVHVEVVEGEIANIDDDQYWKGGIFYFNSNDPSIFVEKRFGIGWTLNFANPLGYLIVLVPLLLIILISFL